MFRDRRLTFRKTAFARQKIELMLFPQCGSNDLNPDLQVTHKTPKHPVGNNLTFPFRDNVKGPRKKPNIKLTMPSERALLRM